MRSSFQNRLSQSILFNICLVMFLVIQSECRASYPEGLWPLNIFGKFSTSQNEKILSYYDFNRDRFVDMLTQSYSYTESNGGLDESQSNVYQMKDNFLNLYLWNQNKQLFENNIKIPFLGQIQSALVSDFDQDGKMLIFLTLKNTIIQKYLIAYYELTCMQNKCQFAPKQQYIQTNTNSDNLPTIAQIHGQQTLIFSQNNKLQTQFFNQTSKKIQMILFSSYVSGDTSKICGNFTNFFYLDFNGDCIQDIIIECKTQSSELQFYKGQSNGKFSYLSSLGTNPSQISIKNIDITIKDISFDGLPDIIIQRLNIETKKYFLEIHYNTATKSTTQNCKLQKQTGFQVPYDFVSLDQLTTKIYKIQRIPLSISFNSLEQKFILRTGDINNDGFTDLIADGQHQSLLLYNELCDDNCVNEAYNLKFLKQWSIFKIRQFKQATINLGNDPKTSIKICSISFFDLYQDGRLDLIGNSCPTENILNASNNGKIVPILNSLSMDVFFIKILILDNMNNQKIQENAIDYRFNSNGGHVDLYVTSLSGQLIPASGDQYSHPGLSLELPFIHLGLGRTNNYVENLIASINRKTTVQTKLWTPIVPNSQLLIVPGPQDKWVLQTFISPTAVMGVVVWFVILILIVMGLYITHLSRLQKKEDKENQESFYSILR